MRKLLFSFLIASLIPGLSNGQSDTLYYEINLSDAASQIFLVNLKFTPRSNAVIDFSIPKWTPGYYQLLDFPEKLSNLSVVSNDVTNIEPTRIDDNTWRIPATKETPIRLSYQIKANKKFIALPYITWNWAFIRPTGIFIYPMDESNRPSKITLTGKDNWKTVSGLKNKDGSFIASNMDQLYDSPILSGDSIEISTFTVKGIPHVFGGIELELEKDNDLIYSLQKMIESATDMMGDMPYHNYVFMSIGNGGGGIEQTNSTAFALNISLYSSPSGRQRILNFLAHEYFHHFNVKRIRPIELGPFDYSKENRTNMLWVSEGLTVYFEDVILNRAGLKTKDVMLRDWSEKISSYENNDGRKFQTLAESSFHTWEDGPFGVPGKTISYYEKGPLIGMLLDLKIRVCTSNNHSLIDVMRSLYQIYYKDKNRGFTENEFKAVCNQIAGCNLDDIFSYIYNLEDIPYEKYFTPAGLSVSRTLNEGKIVISISQTSNLTKLQSEILNDLFR